MARWLSTRLGLALRSLLGLAIVAGTAAAIGVYLWIALHRDTYPFQIEWLESNSLVEVHRILHGQALYVRPNVWFVPDEYPPLYFYVSAVVAAATGSGYAAMRGVSLVASLAALWLLYRLVERETGGRLAGVAAAGLYAAAFFATGASFDVARVDSLFVALSLWGVYLARWARATPGAVAAGAALAAATLTKQTGLAALAAVGLVLVVRPATRRRGLVLLTTAAAILAAVIIVLEVRSRGWFGFYVFELLGEHNLVVRDIVGFWTTDLLASVGWTGGALALWVVVARFGPERPGRPERPATRLPLLPDGGVLFYGGVLAALLLGSWASRAHSGGSPSDLMPAFAAAGLVLGVAVGDLHRLEGSHPHRLEDGHLRRRRDQPGATGGDRRCRRWLPVACAAQVAPALARTLAVVQLGSLALTFRPAAFVPTSVDARVGATFVAALERIPGPVYLPSDPGLLVQAGKRPVAHDAATVDVLRGHFDANAQRYLRASIGRAIADGTFTAIVVEHPPDLAAAGPGLTRSYLACPDPLLARAPPGAFTPFDLHIRPRQLYVRVPPARLTGRRSVGAAGSSCRRWGAPQR
ncbi:MAG: glycosyltransferase family 39 protein [Acidimicrobiales bacterium]